MSLFSNNTFLYIITHYTVLSYHVTDHLEYASILIPPTSCIKRVLTPVFCIFLKNYLNFLMPKITYNYFVCDSKVLWIKHSTWEELSWSFRQTHFINSHYIPSLCLYKSTVIPPPFTRRFHIYTILLRMKHSSAWGMQHLMHEVLSWDKGVHNKLNWRYVISKPC